MPKETISTAHGKKLDVQWGKAGRDADPTPLLTTWIETTSPGGGHLGWEPGPAWALSRDQINHLVRVLRRARDDAYNADA